MREAQFTANVRKRIKHCVYALKLNVSFSNGVPDCYYSGSIRDLWNEHKYYNVLPPVVDLLKVTSALQQRWLTSRHDEGRSVGMVVGSSQGHLFLPGLRWQEPIPRDEFIIRAGNYNHLASLIIQYVGALEEPPIP